MVIHPDSIGVKGITILGWHVSIIFIDGRVGVGVGCCCCCCCCVVVCWCCRGVVSGSVCVCDVVVSIFVVAKHTQSRGKRERDVFLA